MCWECTLEICRCELCENWFCENCDETVDMGPQHLAINWALKSHAQFIDHVCKIDDKWRAEHICTNKITRTDEEHCKECSNKCHNK